MACQSLDRQAEGYAPKVSTKGVNAECGGKPKDKTVAGSFSSTGNKGVK